MCVYISIYIYIYMYICIERYLPIRRTTGLTRVGRSRRGAARDSSGAHVFFQNQNMTFNKNAVFNEFHAGNKLRNVQHIVLN